MKKLPRIDKILALILALVLFTSSSVGVFAEDDDNDASMENVITEVSASQNAAGGEPGATSEQVESVTPTEPVIEPTVETLGGEQLDGESGDGSKVLPSDEEKKEEGEKLNPETGAATENPEEQKDSSKDEKGEADPEKKDDTTVTPEAKKSGEDEKQTEYKYTSNNDGTHTKQAYNADGEPEGEAVTENCEYDKNGVCIHCGYKKPEEETKKEDKKLEANVGDYTVVADFPAEAFDSENVKLIAELNEEYNVENLKETYNVETFKSSKVLNISFKANGESVQPKDGQKVKITIKSLGFTPNLIIHLKDGGSEKISDFSTDDGVSFEASNFSPYVFADVDFATEEIESDCVLYENCAYGKAYTDEKHLEGEYTVNDGYKAGRYAISLYNYNSGDKYAQIAPKTNKYFVYSAKNDSKFNFHFEAPTNYYIASVNLADLKSKTSIKEYKPTDEHATKFDVEIELTQMGSDKYVNEIVVSLLPIPVKWVGDDTETVQGATFVNYKNQTTVFGNSFLFNGGDGSGSNKCHYDQVYQGLAYNTYDPENGGFKLADDNRKRLFPTAKDYEDNTSAYSDYITDYRSNAGVLFKKDTDGYWTIDSSQYQYQLKDNVLTPVSGSQFRPFGTKTSEDKDHFAMELPIKFSINSDGLTNGQDTIFKFAGDDDVYVYIDDKLVLDLGGIHDIIKGQINFKTGEVLIQGDFASKLTSSVDNTCYAAKGLGDKNLYEILGTNLADFSKSEHKLTVIYFERGGYLSNCRISYNFNKDKTVEVEYEGLKVAEDKKTKLEGAEFTLYEDEDCKHPVMNGVNALTATTDANGTIKFTGISVGIITSSTTSVDKTLYMKETKAANNYQLPENAVWKLDIHATANSSSSTLIAVTEEAEAISILNSEEAKSVKAIMNKEVKTVYGDFAGKKEDANGKPLAGATFAIYSDVACTKPVVDANEKAITATSDDKGKFEFKNLLVGKFEKSTTTEVTTDYYIKETEAPEGFKLPKKAVWKLTLTAPKDGKVTSIFEAATEEAKALSIVDSKKIITAIKNEKLTPGNLRIIKTLLTARKSLGTASFVFEVSYTEDGIEHSDVYSYDFTEAGTKDSIVVKNLPAGIDITVREIYEGSSYKLTKVETEYGDVVNNVATVRIPEDDEAVVKFVNDYEGGNNVGSVSIVNVFEKIKDAAGYIFKEKKGGEQ